MIDPDAFATVIIDTIKAALGPVHRRLDTIERQVGITSDPKIAADAESLSNALRAELKGNVS